MLLVHKTVNVVKDSVPMDVAKLVSPKDNQEPSVTDMKIVLVKENWLAASENQLSTLISPFANHHLVSTWYVDQSTSSETYTSELKYKKHVDPARKNSSANKSVSLVSMKFVKRKKT